MKAYSLSPKIPVVFMLANNPWLLIVVPILLNLYFGWLPLVSTVPFDVQTKLGIWLISLVVWTSLVLGVKKLLIFGEGQRYLEYCILPISILIASYVPGLANRFGNLAYLIFGVVCVAMTGVIIFLQYKAVVKDRARSITKEVWQIIAYLNKQRSQVRLAMFPIQLGDAIVYFTKASILTSDLYSGLRQLSDLYPIIKKPLPEILKRYKINYVFFDRTFVELKELKINKYKIVLDLNNYVLLKV